MRFQDIGAVIDVLDTAYDEGMHTFMCTTHDRIALVADHVRANPSAYPNFTFFPCMPYAHKYANAVTEDGMLGALRRFLPDEGLLDAAMRGGRSLATQGHRGHRHAPDRRRDEDVRGPQDAGDLAAERRRRPAARAGFQGRVPDLQRPRDARYGAEPGFITMNLPMLLDTLDEVGVENPIVCANINKIGFRMCGGLDAYERALRERDVPGGRHVGLRLGRHPAPGGHRVGVRAAEHPVDRLRRLQRGEHPEHAGTGRRALGAVTHAG